MNRHPGASASTLSGLALTLTLTLVGAETALATSAPAHATLSVSTTDSAGSIDPTNPGSNCRALRARTPPGRRRST
jgi:hypothetical protein